MSRVLGVDPGLTRCGIGVIDVLPGRKVALVEYGVARTNPGLPIGERLLSIATEMDAWIDRHEPQAIAVERVFAQHNVSTVMGTAQVAGLLLVAATRRKIPVAMHTPSEVKAAVTGHGGADKEQVQRMVQSILSLDAPPQPADAADALALAICHAWRPTIAASAQNEHAAGSTPAQRRWAEAEQAARRRRS